MLENTYVVFVGFWDLNSITKQLSWSPHGFMNPEFWIHDPELLCLIQRVFWQKIITNKQTKLFPIGSKIRETMHSEHHKRLNK